jgi:hypothetical protein
MVAAFILSEGFPQNFERPPFLNAGYMNGRGTQYRPFDANQRAYSQQWNLTVEREIGKDIMVSTAYVGNTAIHLPSAVAPPNVLNPSLLSMGNSLESIFEPGQTELNGVRVPYDGWIDQLSAAGCDPSVAQAMLPFPQYCSRLQGTDENAGNSSFHSLQLKVDKRFSRGTFLLVSYTWSKLITTSQQSNEPITGTWSGQGSTISPFERNRAKVLSNDDVPQTLSVSFIYDLPGVGEGAIRAITGGWALTSIFRATSGVPFYFRDAPNCILPAQFRMRCIPGYDDRTLYAQPKESFDPAKGPIFSVGAFETIQPYDQGAGTPMTNERGFGFYNHDFSVIKNTPIGEHARLQLRFEFFNLWNWHTFTGRGVLGSLPFNTSLASPDFGYWNGTVSQPRIIQLGARLEF